MLSDRAFEQGLDLAIAGIEADMAPEGSRSDSGGARADTPAMPVT
jgi:hypothetical protein